MQLPVISEAFQIGPAAIPARPLFIVVGAWLTYMLVGKSARQRGLDPDLAESAMLWVILMAWIGAKMPEIIRSPASFTGGFRAWVSLPVGWLPVMTSIVGATIGMFLGLRKRPGAIAGWLDAVSWPLLAGIATGCLGIGDTRAIPMAIAFLAAALVVRGLQKHAKFDGHVFLAAIVVGSLALAAGDLFRPLPPGWSWFSPAQLVALAAALAAFTLAWWRDGGQQ